SVMLTVLSGQIVVHSESTNARTTAWPRNWRSETGAPNWLVSVKPGAAVPGRRVPGSTSGFAAAWPASGLAAGGCGLVPDREAITAMRIAISTSGMPITRPMTSLLAAGRGLPPPGEIPAAGAAGVAPAVGSAVAAGAVSFAGVASAAGLALSAGTPSDYYGA